MKCVNSTVSQSRARLKAKLKSSRKLNKQFKQIKEQVINLPIPKIWSPFFQQLDKKTALWEAVYSEILSFEEFIR